MRMMTTGPWYVFFFFGVLFILIDGFCFYLGFKRMGRVRVGGSDENRSKRHKTCRLGPTYVFIFLSCFLLLTNVL